MYKLCVIVSCIDIGFKEETTYMDLDQQEQKKHLEQQLQWSKERVCIVDEMNVKLA